MVESLTEKDGIVDPGINGKRILKEKTRSWLNNICLRIGT